MNIQQAKEALELLGHAGRDRADQRYHDLERQLDASDRVISQAAQLLLIRENQQLPELPAELLAEADPT